MDNEEIIVKLNAKATEFEKSHGGFLCLRANIAAINNMLIKRKRGEELLQEFSSIIKKFDGES